jgi:hypothetical protein
MPYPLDLPPGWRIQCSASRMTSDSLTTMTCRAVFVSQCIVSWMTSLLCPLGSYQYYWLSGEYVECAEVWLYVYPHLSACILGRCQSFLNDLCTSSFLGLHFLLICVYSQTDWVHVLASYKTTSNYNFVCFYLNIFR